MTPVHELIRSARVEAGLSQAELATRLGTSQPAIARLERATANPTITTLDRVLRATGRRLELKSTQLEPSVDRGLIRRHLEAPPQRRLEELEAMYAEARKLARAGERSRGRLA